MRLLYIMREVAYTIWFKFIGGYFRSYSQFGEDAVLRAFLHDKWTMFGYKGFWVDVGANHPVNASNTKMFSEHGWRGINVDANAEAIEMFKKERPHDINVNAGIGEASGILDFYMCRADSLFSTFSREFAERASRENGKTYEVEKVPVITLEELLDRHLPAGQHIDFFSIDAEGLDIEILRSNDWDKYRPDYVFVEVHTFGHNEKIFDCEVTRYMAEQGYEFVAQCAVTTLFKNTKQQP